MSVLEPVYISLGKAQQKRKIAYFHHEGEGPGLFWLGGYNSSMTGTKAEALYEFGKAHNLAVTRFDYMGHGQSSGDFLAANISLWLKDTLAVFEKCCQGPQIFVGSSMGGWLAMLANHALRQRGIELVKAMILIAPAIDMTAELIPQRFTPQQLAQIKAEGFISVPSQYDEAPYIYTQNLLDDGEQHLIYNAPIKTGCPVHILQGQRDRDVPPAHAQRLMQHLMLDEVQLSLVPDGDHRLSRPQDIELLKRAISAFV